MNAIILSNSFAHLPSHERRYGKENIKRQVFKANTKEDLFETIYSKNCSEAYCYPRSDYRFVSKTLSAEFKQWQKDGGIALYARYNRMD